MYSITAKEVVSINKHFLAHAHLLEKEDLQLKCYDCTHENVYNYTVHCMSMNYAF